MASTSGTIAATLKKLSVAATGLTTTIGIAITLPRLATAVVATKGITQSGAVAATFPKLATSVNTVKLIASNSIICVTGYIASDGCAFFQFQGPPNAAVVWTVSGGQILPLTGYTDGYGFAYARYVAGGFFGTLNVQVAYGV